MNTNKHKKSKKKRVLHTDLLDLELRILKAAKIVKEEIEREPWDEIGDIYFDMLPDELCAIAEALRRMRLSACAKATEGTATEGPATEGPATESTETTEKGNPNVG